MTTMIVQVTDVIVFKDVSILQYHVMTIMPVPMILVALAAVVFTLPLFVRHQVYASSLLVSLPQDVSLHPLTATITISALLILVMRKVETV